MTSTSEPGPAATDDPGAPSGPSWSPGQYLKFADHRLRPALELLARIPLEAPRVIVDLGCGAGNVTRAISQRWGTATIYGVDSSEEMLDKARAGPGPVRWRRARIEHWVPDEPPDLIYSNATLHWIDDHPALFPRLLGLLGSGGCLAVQMPLSWGAPSHRLVRETLADGGVGGTALGTPSLRRAVARKWVEDATVYYDLLADPARSLDIWETEYLQVLEGPDPVLEWIRGSALRPVLSGLDDEQRARFLAEYGRRLRDAYPARADGHTLYPFRRLFIVAVI